MNLTLEERERRAYITNAPDHPLLVLALDAENDALDEMRHERDMARQDAEYSDSKLTNAEEDLASAEEELVKATRECDELREQLAARPEPKTKPARRSRKVEESVADLL